MTVLVHADEGRAVWVLETRDHRGDWRPVDMPPQRLLDLLQWYVPDACDPDRPVALQFRNVESQEAIPLETAYARFFPSG